MNLLMNVGAIEMEHVTELDLQSLFESDINLIYEMLNNDLK